MLCTSNTVCSFYPRNNAKHLGIIFVWSCFFFFFPCEAMWGEHVGHLPERAQLPTDYKTERHRRVPEDCFVAFSVTVVVQFLRVSRRQVSWGWCPNLANVTLVDALFFLCSCLCRCVGMTRNGSADPTYNRNCYSLVPKFNKTQRFIPHVFKA